LTHIRDVAATKKIQSQTPAHLHTLKRGVSNCLKTKAKSYVYSKYGALSDNEITSKLKTYFRVSMRSLEKTDDSSYGTMLQMLSFFELVGQLVKEKYVRLNDIDSLFRGAILDIGVAYVDHIKDEVIAHAPRVLVKRRLGSAGLGG
jgi:hypothetical protein